MCRTRWHIGAARPPRPSPPLSGSTLPLCSCSCCGEARGRRRVEPWLDDRQPERTGNSRKFKATVDPKRKSLHPGLWVDWGFSSPTDHGYKNLIGIGALGTTLPAVHLSGPIFAHLRRIMRKSRG